MEVMINIFIVAAILIGLFFVFIVGRDVVLEEKEKRQKRRAAEPPSLEDLPDADDAFEASGAEHVACAAMSRPDEPKENAATEATAATVTTAATASDLSENTIAFSAERSTLDEKYLELTAEQKGYYDEIVRCAMAVDGSKRYKNAGAEEYKVGRNTFVKIKIRRGVIICELVIPNLAFKNYVNDNKVAVKQAPAAIKVTDEAALSAVKDSILIAVKAIEEERTYKKEQAKLRRKRNYANARGAAGEKAE